MAEKLIDVQKLSTSFQTRKGLFNAIQNVEFSVAPGEILGIVGESGCGKSVTSMSILRLLADNAVIDKNSGVMFANKDIAHIPMKDLRKIRGNDIAMIFQDPMTSLNPVMTIEKQLMEAVRAHKKISKAEARAKALEMLKKVGIPSPEERMKEFPHQLSGGMKQRVMIAMALICDPILLIADEPTTALDVTVQAQILSLMKDLQKQTNAAIMLITHDMGVVASMADKIMIMYAGRVVEYGSARQVFKEPKHPYTVGLLKSIPRLDDEVDRLFTIEGSVPSAKDMPTGCKFSPRCFCAEEKCFRDEPDFYEESGHRCRCFNRNVKIEEAFNEQ